MRLSDVTQIFLDLQEQIKENPEVVFEGYDGRLLELNTVTHSNDIRSGLVKPTVLVINMVS